MGQAEQVQPKTVVELLKTDGIIITPDEAKQILQFMYMLANIALDIMENRKRL